MPCDDRSSTRFGARQNIPQAATLFGIACQLRSGSEYNSELRFELTYAFEPTYAFELTHMLSEPPRVLDRE